jgi:hypothetical protein
MLLKMSPRSYTKQWRGKGDNPRGGSWVVQRELGQEVGILPRELEGSKGGIKIAESIKE